MLQELGFVFRGTIDQMLSPRDGRILQFDGLFENSSIMLTPDVDSCPVPEVSPDSK